MDLSTYKETICLYSKAVPLQTWSGPEGSRELKFPNYMTTAQDGGKVVSPKYRPPLHPGSAPGTHFCQKLSRPQGHSAIGRIISMKNSNDTNLGSNQRPSELQRSTLTTVLPRSSRIIKSFLNANNSSVCQEISSLFWGSAVSLTVFKGTRQLSLFRAR